MTVAGDIALKTGVEGDDLNDTERHNDRPTLTTVAVDTTQTDLSWTPVQGNPTGYEVGWLPGVGGPWRAIDPAHEGAGLAYSHRNLTPGDRHLYRVRAIFAGGVTGEWSDEVSAVTPKDTGMGLKKWLLIGGAVVALIVVIGLLASRPKDPNEIAETFIKGNIDQAGEQIAGFVVGDNWLLKELGGEWVEDRIHDIIKWSYTEARPMGGDGLYLVVATARVSFTVDYAVLGRTYSVEASLPFNLEVDTDSEIVKSEPNYAAGRVTHDIPAVPQLPSTEDAVEKVDEAKDKAQDLLKKLSN